MSLAIRRLAVTVTVSSTTEEETEEGAEEGAEEEKETEVNNEGSELGGETVCEETMEGFERCSKRAVSTNISSMNSVEYETMSAFGSAAK
jgi:hypothetical protein